MKIIFSIAVLILGIRSQAADLKTGHYVCRDPDQKIVGSFAVGAKGQSKQVEIQSVEAFADPRGLESCSTVTFQIKGGKQVDFAECCPSSVRH